MFEDLTDSYPPIGDQLDPSDRAFLDELPASYRAFLLQHNGGFADEFRYTFSTGVPIKTEKVQHESRDDSVVELFGIPTCEPRDGLPADLLQLRVDHEAEQFLPLDVIAIARCVQNSLVCISLRREDHGAIYYWDWYWQYPWCKPWFIERVRRAEVGFGDPRQILADPSHPQHQALGDALNYATLVRLADTFEAWCGMCRDARTRDA